MSAQTDLLTVIHQVDPMYVIVSAPGKLPAQTPRDRTLKRIQGRGHLSIARASSPSWTAPSIPTKELGFAGCRSAHRDGTAQVRVVFPNPERGVTPGERALLPGQFVKVRFIGSVRTGVDAGSRSGRSRGTGGTRGLCRRDGRKGGASPRQGHKLAGIASGSSKEGCARESGSW